MQYDQKTKHDANKTHRPELLPHEALMEVIEVFTDGAKEYSDHGWRGGIYYSRLYGAALRHIIDFWRGNTIDEKSGSPALAHAIANLMMLLEMDSDWDDRSREYDKNDELSVIVEGIHPYGEITI